MRPPPPPGPPRPVVRRQCACQRRSFPRVRRGSRSQCYRLLTRPLLPPRLPSPSPPQVGGKTLVRWFGHYGALLAYSLAYALLRPLRPVVPGYGFQRLLDALEYGSGSDYRWVGQHPQRRGASALRLLYMTSLQPYGSCANGKNPKYHLRVTNQMQRSHVH